MSRPSRNYWKSITYVDYVRWQWTQESVDIMCCTGNPGRHLKWWWGLGILSGSLESLIGRKWFACPCALTSSYKILSCNCVTFLRKQLSVFAWNFFGNPELFVFFWNTLPLGNYPVPWHHGNLLGHFFFFFFF